MSETQQAPRKRRPRSPSAVKPAFVVLQILDENGNPMPRLDKKRIKVVSIERDAEKVMALTDEDDNLFYIRVVVPPAAPTQVRNKPGLQAAA